MKSRPLNPSGSLDEDDADKLEGAAAGGCLQQQSCVDGERLFYMSGWVSAHRTPPSCSSPPSSSSTEIRLSRRRFFGGWSESLTCFFLLFFPFLDAFFLLLCFFVALQLLPLANCFRLEPTVVISSEDSDGSELSDEDPLVQEIRTGYRRVDLRTCCSLLIASRAAGQAFATPSMTW